HLITGGNRWPSLLVAPNTELERNSSSSQCRQADSGCAGPDDRLFRLVRQPSEWGNQKNSKCSFSLISSGSLAITSDQRIGSSRACSKNAGSTRKVTAVSKPSAPSPTLAAANRSAGPCSAEHVTMLPSASTNSRP